MQAELYQTFNTSVLQTQIKGAKEIGEILNRMHIQDAIPNHSLQIIVDALNAMVGASLTGLEVDAVGVNNQPRPI